MHIPKEKGYAMYKLALFDIDLYNRQSDQVIYSEMPDAM